MSLECKEKESEFLILQKIANHAIWLHFYLLDRLCELKCLVVVIIFLWWLTLPTMEKNMHTGYKEKQEEKDE